MAYFNGKEWVSTYPTQQKNTNILPTYTNPLLSNVSGVLNQNKTQTVPQTTTAAQKSTTTVAPQKSIQTIVPQNTTAMIEAEKGAKAAAKIDNKSPADVTPASGGNGGGNGVVENYGGSAGSSAGGSALSGVSSDVYNKMNSTFQASQAYLDAMNYTNGLLQKLSDGRTSYTDQLKGMMDGIMNRDPFKYDVDTDTLFQQYLQSSMNKGKMAMADTMGQAAALSGGYGSSYATTAGNQAYNAYLQQAYDNLPQYYQLARDAYDKDTENLYRQYGLLSDADQQEYDRLYNAYTANFNNAQTQYGNEFNEWNANTSNAFNLANMQQSDYWNRQEMAYKQAQAARSQKQWEAEYALKAASAAKDASAGSKYSEEKIMGWMGDALGAYNNDGYEGFMSYMDKLPSDLETDTLMRMRDYVLGTYDDGGNKLLDGYGQQSIGLKEGTVKRIADRNGEPQYQDMWGNTYSAQELYHALGTNWAGNETKEFKQISQLGVGETWKSAAAIEREEEKKKSSKK